MNKTINFERDTGNIICGITSNDSRLPLFDRLSFIIKTDEKEKGHFKHVVFSKYGNHPVVIYENMTSQEFNDFISALQEIPDEQLPEKESIILKLKKIYELQESMGIENSNSQEIMNIINELKEMNLNRFFRVEVEEEVNQFESTEDMDIRTEKNMFEGLPVNGIYITENTGTEVTKGFNAGTFAGYPAEISTYKVHGSSKMFVEIDYRDPKQTRWPKAILLFVDKNGK